MLRAQTSWSIILITSLAILVTYRLYFKEVSELITPIGRTTNYTKVIIAFGDSLTEGLFDWPNSRSFHPYTIKLQRLISNEIKKSDSKLDIIVRNFGISGERLRESMEQRLRHVVDTTHPDLLIILGGTNDLLDMEKEVNDYDSIKRTNEIIQGLKTLHLLCYYKGIPTVALSIPETAIDDRDQNATVATMRRKINKELRDFARRSQVKATFVDISTIIGRKHKKYWDDGVHFTPIGYDRVGEVIYAEIKDMIRSWIKKGG